MTDDAPDTLPEPLAPEASGEAHILPAPGDDFRSRTVRASGEMPYSGTPFVLVRHTGRDQFSAARVARESASAEGHDATEGDSLIALIARILWVHENGEWRRLKHDEILDLDGDDLDHVGEAMQSAPRPPKPTS